MIDGNATTDNERKEILRRLFAVWCELPELRLGQLICSAAGPDTADPFYTRDDALISNVEGIAARRTL